MTLKCDEKCLNWLAPKQNTGLGTRHLDQRNHSIGNQICNNAVTNLDTPSEVFSSLFSLIPVLQTFVKIGYRGKRNYLHEMVHLTTYWHNYNVLGRGELPKAAARLNNSTKRIPSKTYCVSKINFTSPKFY